MALLIATLAWATGPAPAPQQAAQSAESNDRAASPRDFSRSNGLGATAQSRARGEVATTNLPFSEQATGNAQPGSEQAAQPVSAQVRPGGPSPEQIVRRAWQQACDAGAYRFTSDLVQLLYPAHSLANAGSTPQREELHLEGDVDLAAQTLQMKR
jgi:hypothetical protein